MDETTGKENERIGDENGEASIISGGAQKSSEDTRNQSLAEMGGDLLSNPLERNLGFYDFGRYRKAPGNMDYTFEKLNDLWGKEIHSDESDEESSDENMSEADNRNETTVNEDTSYPTEIRTTRNTNRGGTNQNHLERKILKRKKPTHKAPKHPKRERSEWRRTLPPQFGSN